MIYAAVFFWLALQSISPEGAQHMQAGVDAHKQGQFDVAIREFRKATESDPNLPEAFLDLGEVCLETRDYPAAVAALKRALELSPELDAAHLQLGYALLAQGYAEEAIPHLQRVNAQEALGIAQIDTGQYEEAVANLNAALVKRPGDPDLLRSIDTLLGAYPDSARSHQAMGENYFVLRQMPQAAAEFGEALHQRPEIPGLHLELGLVYAGAARWDKAEEEFRVETKMQPGNAEAAYRLGAALLQQGKAHEARQELERADQLKPDMPETLYSLGKAASLDGNPAAAEKAWTRVIDLEKESSLAAQAHFGLANLYRKEGNAAKAQHEMQEYKRLQDRVPKPQNPPS